MSPARRRAPASPAEPAPVQAVERPILGSPYDEPSEHWVYGESGAAPARATGRRPASYFFMSKRTGAAQLGMFAEPERDELPLVNLLRADVKRWREAGYPGAATVTKGPEAFGRRVLGDLYDRGPILVLNDEAHHAYRPAPISDDDRLAKDAREEREEATVWVEGLDRINAGAGIAFCADLSATPFYIAGSGHVEGGASTSRSIKSEPEQRVALSEAHRASQAVYIFEKLRP